MPYQMFVGKGELLEDSIQTASSCTKESTRRTEFREDVINQDLLLLIKICNRIVEE